MFVYLKLAGIVVILGMTFAGGYRLSAEVYGTKLAKAETQYEVNLKAVSDLAAKAAAANLAIQQEMEAQIAASDAKHSQEMAHANTEIIAAQLQLSARPDSFSVLANCPANDPAGGSVVPGPTNAPSVDHGPRQVRAVVDPRTVKRLLDATARGDKAITQLSALQDYVRVITSKTGSK